MKNARYCNICKSTNDGYFEIAMIDNKHKTYTLCLNCYEPELDFLEETIIPTMLDESTFDKTLSSLKKDCEIDFSKQAEESFERFYTNSKRNREKVDAIEINVEYKKCNVFINYDDQITDGYDEFGIPVYSTYVSRFVFDALLNALDSNGFKKQIYKE